MKLARSTRSFYLLVAAVLGLPVALGSPQANLVRVSGRFNSPVAVTTLPGRSDILIVAERSKAQIILDVSAVGMGGPGAGFPGLGTPRVRAIFLDLGAVTNAVTSFVDQDGIQGMAFHPNFNQGILDRYFYVRYSTNVPAQGLRIRIERYHVPVNSLFPDSATAQLVFEEYFTNASTGDHQGGQIAFDRSPIVTNGIEYYLFTGIGDLEHGSSQACDFSYCPPDPEGLWLAQYEPSLAGKLLRFAVSSAQTGPVTPEIIAKGLRNPFGIHVDRGDSSGVGAGMVWIADTGSSPPGEINSIDGRTAVPCSVGPCVNFGWPRYEGAPGTANTNMDGVCSINPCVGLTGLPGTAPVYAVAQSQGRVCFSGLLYRGAEVPGYGGEYLYGIMGRPGGDGFFRMNPLAPVPFTSANDLSSILGIDNPSTPKYFDQWKYFGVGESFDTGELLIIRQSGIGQPFGKGVIFAMVN